jgi:methyl-accepting chemotaxis protein
MSQRTQGHELAAFGIHLMVASLAFALVLALGIGAMMLLRWAVPLELASSSSQRALEASGRILDLHERFWPVTLASLVGVAVAAGWLGRRITGPLVRFGGAFARIAAGQIPEPIAIRSTDYLRGEVETFNAMVTALSARAAERERGRAEVLAALDELREHAAKSDDETLATLVTKVEERMRVADGAGG